jgi:hypothetical protein
MDTTLQQLAAKPAGDEQVDIARRIIGDSVPLVERLAAFMASHPTRGRMNDFLADLRVAAAEEKVMAQIQAICRAAGIERPSGTELLMAMQVALLQEQNAMLRGAATRMLNQMGADADARHSGDLFSDLLAAAALITIATRS